VKTGFARIELTLEKLTENNDKLQTDISEMRNEIIKGLIEANKQLQEKVEKLEKKIKKSQESLKTDIESNNQYVRRNNIEISGIPNEVKDEDLECKVIDILHKADVEVANNDVEACHRLPGTGLSTVRTLKNA